MKKKDRINYIHKSTQFYNMRKSPCDGCIHPFRHDSLMTKKDGLGKEEGPAKYSVIPF